MVSFAKTRGIVLKISIYMMMISVRQQLATVLLGQGRFLHAAQSFAFLLTEPGRTSDRMVYLPLILASGSYRSE